MRRVTMKDVARRAGVSQPTVSFVINGRRDVSVAESTRARVLKAAEELHFQPNWVAQSLRSSRSFLVAILADRIVAEPYAGQIVLGVQKAVQAAGYVCFVVETSETPDAGRAAVDDLIRQGVAGLVYAAPGPRPLDRATTGGTRSVFVNGWPSDDSPAQVILADEYQGEHDAATAVFAAGHRRVAFLGGVEEEYACQERERGLLEAAAEAGIDPGSIHREYGNYQVSSGYELALRVLSDGSPTALLCGNDRMAIGALIAMHSMGLSCPEDVSIVGFDDQPDIADQLHPTLTTVALPHLEMGFAAGQMILADDERPGRHLVPCTYIPRASLAPPAS